MTPTSDDIKKLCEYAIEAAVSAGEYIAKTRPLNVEHKNSSGSLATQVVTEVDRESQARILRILEPTFAQYDLGLLTEESPDDGSRLLKDYFWCIDPIDGTLCFIEGAPGYAVSIALIARDGIPYIGVVYDPAERVLYHAIRDGSAFKNSIPWQPDFSQPDEPLTIFTDRSQVANLLFEPVARAMNASWGTYGGGVSNAIWCLENAPACYFKFTKPGSGGGCIWDFAATTCIYRELGAWASDVHGAPLNLNRDDSIHMSHCGVLFATHSTIAQRFLQLHQKVNSTE